MNQYQDVVNRIAELLMDIEFVCMTMEECARELYDSLAEYNMEGSLEGLFNIVAKMVAGKVDELSKIRPRFNNNTYGNYN